MKNSKGGDGKHFMAWQCQSLSIKESMPLNFTTTAQKTVKKPCVKQGFIIRVIALGFEPRTVCLEGRCSIQLSYATDTVGVAGFEPATSCSQSRRDDRATLHPVWGRV